MKKHALLCIAISATGLAASAQTDTLFMNNQKLPVLVREVTEDAVKYSYPNEDLVNTVYKNGLEKIVFKSGRVQTFAESSSFKKVASVNDFANVTITSVEGEIKGLYKLGDVSSKAKGTTTFSNQERVKERAYRKLKIQAAMMGANIVFLTNQRTEGNKFGGYFQSGSSAETNLTGVSYSNMLPDFNQFKKLIASRTDFVTYEQFKLGASDADLSTEVDSRALTIKNIINDNGIVTIEGTLDGVTKYDKFMLSGLSADHFNIFYRDKGTVYNYSVKF